MSLFASFFATFYLCNKRRRLRRRPLLELPMQPVTTRARCPTTPHVSLLPPLPRRPPVPATHHPVLFATVLQLVQDLRWLRARIGCNTLTTWRVFDERVVCALMHRRYVYECERLDTVDSVPRIPRGWYAHSFARYCTMLPPPPCAWQSGLSSEELRRYVTGAYTLDHIYAMRNQEGAAHQEKSTVMLARCV